MAEQAAVNRKVVSSSLTPGAIRSADCREAVCGNFCQRARHMILPEWRNWQTHGT